VSEAKRALDDGRDAAVRPSVRLKHETRVGTRFADAETMARGHQGAVTPAVTYDGGSALTGLSIAAPAAGSYVVEFHLVVQAPVAVPDDRRGNGA
jgi:hypothetical protein